MAEIYDFTKYNTVGGRSLWSFAKEYSLECIKFLSLNDRDMDIPLWGKDVSERRCFVVRTLYNLANGITWLCSPWGLTPHYMAAGIGLLSLVGNTDAFPADVNSRPHLFAAALMYCCWEANVSSASRTPFNWIWVCQNISLSIDLGSPHRQNILTSPFNAY